MDEITWKYVKELKNTNVVDAFEKEKRIEFPNDLKQVLLKYNGGRPSLKYYDLQNEKDKEFKTLLSFNETDIENIYKHFPLDSKFENLIPFASDPAGNYFVLSNKKICLWNHETDTIQEIAKTFSDFLQMLHN